MANFLTYPGCYGKLPAVGDFLSKRLEPGFVANWDRWLQAGLQDSRANLGSRWNDCYLSAPIWRFVLTPGVCSERAVLGVLMPSVDSVGRYFPFSIVQEVGHQWACAWAMADASGWFDRLERIALAGLNDNLSPEIIDDRLSECTLHNVCAEPDSNVFQSVVTPDRPAVMATSGSGSVQECLMMMGGPVMERALGRQGIWWQGYRGGARQLRRCAHLSPDFFTSLLVRTGA